MDGRFWSKVNKTDECWLWTAGTVGKATQRYGGFWYKGKLVRAHRFSYEETYGAIPDDLCVLHKCDTPLCVRPDHLFLGTVVGNNEDKMTKGRYRSRGDNLSCRKGHPWTEENIQWVDNGASKSKVRRCRECLNTRRRTGRPVGRPKKSNE